MGLDYTCCVVLLPYGEAATLPKMANRTCAIVGMWT